MQKNEDRLDQIEKELTPRQKFFAWHELSEPYIESPEDYRRGALDNWTVPAEGKKLTFMKFLTEIAAWIKEQSRAGGQPKDEETLRETFRDLSFLYCLSERVRRRLLSELTLMEYLGEQLKASFKIFKNHLQQKRASHYQSLPHQVLSFPSTLTDLILIVFDHKSTVDYLQNQYFEGHSILTSNQAESLVHFLEIIRQSEELISFMKSTCLKRGRKKQEDKARADKLPEHNSVWNVLHSEVDPVKHTQYLVDLAKADALKHIDERDASYGFRKRGIEALMKRFGLEEEKDPERV